MSFKKLLEEIEGLNAKPAEGSLAKALPAGEEDDKKGGDGDDAAIAAAAAAGGTDTGSEGDKPKGKDDDEEEDGEELGKAMRLYDEEGKPVEALDATEVVAHLTKKVEKATELAKAAPTEDMLVKAINPLVGLIKDLTKAVQGLKADVERIGDQGTGRQSVTGLTKAQALEGADKPAQIPAAEFMSKALEAQRAGRVTGQDVATAEACLNRGIEVPAGIRARVEAQAKSA